MLLLSILRLCRSAVVRGHVAAMLGVIALCTLVATGAVAAEQRRQVSTAPQAGSRLVAAVTEVSRQPYQVVILGDCVTGSNYCNYDIDVVPANRRLEIHRVSCQGWHSNATAPTFVVIANLKTAAGGFLRRVGFLEVRYTRVGINAVWSISEAPLMFVSAGQRVQIALNSASTGVGSYGCAISGYLVRLKPS